MAQQYRHITAYNPERLVCNHNLFDIAAPKLSENDQLTLVGVLNSTLVGLFKTFYGRFAGTEGNLKTEVIDVNLLDVPDPRQAPAALTARIRDAFERLTQRPIGRLVEEQLMDCHSPEHAQIIASGPLRLADELRQPDRRALDDAVFEPLGAADSEARRRLVDKLHEETAQHFRKVRVVEIQKQEQRLKTGFRRLTSQDLAADTWDAGNLPDCRPIIEWLSDQSGPKKEFTIPDGHEARLMAASDMYDRNVLYFGTGRSATKITCGSRPQTELLASLANLGLRGRLAVPAEEASCRDSLTGLDSRLKQARSEFEALVASRTTNEKIQAEVTDLLMHWFVHGRGRRDETESINVAPG